MADGRQGPDIGYGSTDKAAYLRPAVGASGDDDGLVQDMAGERTIRFSHAI
jgi:hypothetical protein